MGVTIESKNYSIDMGYCGFNNLRMKVADLSAQDIGEHYRNLHDGLFLLGIQKESFFKEYDKKTQKLDEKYNGEKSHILDFLYESDCEGEMDVEHCKAIYEVIKEYDDDILYGYAGRKDCAKFKDFKELVKDCIDSNCNMTWW